LAGTARKRNAKRKLKPNIRGKKLQVQEARGKKRIRLKKRKKRGVSGGGNKKIGSPTRLAVLKLRETNTLESKKATKGILGGAKTGVNVLYQQNGKQHKSQKRAGWGGC